MIFNLHGNQVVFSNKDYQVVAIVYNKLHGRWCQDGAFSRGDIDLEYPMSLLWAWERDSDENSK
jgi:hypothetical protein